jgi:hypothetical protein
MTLNFTRLCHDWIAFIRQNGQLGTFEHENESAKSPDMSIYQNVVCLAAIRSRFYELMIKSCCNLILHSLEEFLQNFIQFAVSTNLHAVAYFSSFISVNMSVERLFKIIIIGDPTVGKTSFVQRYVNDMFRRDYKGTIGGKQDSPKQFFLTEWSRQIFIQKSRASAEFLRGWPSSVQ